MRKIDRIRQMIQMSKEEGLVKCEIEGMVFHIAPKAKEITYSPELKSDELVSPLSAFDELSDDEVLFYSSPYYNDLQIEKEKQNKRLWKEDLNEHN